MAAEPSKPSDGTKTSSSSVKITSSAICGELTSASVGVAASQLPATRIEPASARMCRSGARDAWPEVRVLAGSTRTTVSGARRFKDGAPSNAMRSSVPLCTETLRHVRLG